MKKFDPSIPRRMFWSKDVGGKSRCPRCSTILENEHHMFLMATRRAHDIETFLVGNDAGYFCMKCPTIVIDGDSFADFARISIGGDTDFEFSVLGLVDLGAVPKDKGSLPLGGDDNPIPLVQFSNMSEREPKPGEGTTASKRKRVKRKKRWR